MAKSSSATERADRCFVVIGLLSLVPILVGNTWGGVLPPPSPTQSAQDLAAFYAENGERIRWSMFIGMFGAAFWLPWGIVLTKQFRRMTGRNSTAVYFQLACAVLHPVWIIACYMFIATAAYRPTRSPEVVELISDLSWIWAIGIVFNFIVQIIFSGWYVLMHQRDSPIFPKWYAYFNFAVVVPQIFGGLAVVYTSGPFAWNGVLGFYVSVASWAAWNTVTSVLMWRAIGQPDPEPVDPAVAPT